MKAHKKKQSKKNKQDIIQKTKKMAAQAGESIKETAVKAEQAIKPDKEEAKNKPTAKIKQTQASDLKENDLILDIRSHLQHAKMALKRPHWHIEAADLNPKEFIKNYHLDGSKTLYIICSTGKKSMEMARKFIDAGFKNVSSVIGGIASAKEEGLKMIEHTSWDIQRQAYLTAGTLILVGFLLSGMLTRLFLVIPFVVGLCLTIQGLSGIALIDNALEKMPWNKQESVAPSSTEEDDDEEDDDDEDDEEEDEEEEEEDTDEEEENEDEKPKGKASQLSSTEKKSSEK